MTLKSLDNFSKNIKGKLRFDYCLKNHTWLNIGGNAKIFFVPETLTELRDFLLYIKNDHNNFFIIGAGSNLLISENIKNRIFIKLGKNFNKISLTKDNVELELAVKVLISVIAPAGKLAALVTLLKLLLLYLTNAI